MGETVVLSAEVSEKISRVRKAEEELNAAVRALPNDIEATFTTMEYGVMGVPLEREMIVANLRKRL